MTSVSVRHAIRIGSLVVNGPVLLLIIDGFLWSTSMKDGPVIWLPAVGGFILAWIWWSVAIVKWRAWAYRNVQLEHIMELKSAAIRANLAWPDGSFFAKTEIKSKKERDAELSIERAANAESIREMSPAQNWRNYVWTTIIIALIIILSKLVR